MAIKKLQNDFTTPEQSKRLLKLGLPADSANLGIVEDIMNGGVEILQVPYSQWCKGYESISTPSWSAGRLMEIFDMCCVRERTAKGGWCSYRRLHRGQTYLNYIIAVFVINKKRDLLDFSKLEE